MNRTYKPLTVEQTAKFAETCREQGHPELGEVFDRIAVKVAQFNERNRYTVEELRQLVGDDEYFFKLLFGDK